MRANYAIAETDTETEWERKVVKTELVQTEFRSIKFILIH